MKLAHARALSVALPVWMYLLVWLWPRAARADALSADVHVYDWNSLGYACLLGLAGGFLALIVALATDRRVVTEVLLEGARNGLVSPIAGGGAYLVLKVVASLGYVVTTEPRFLVIVGSGWAGIAFFQWWRGLVSAGAPRVQDGLIEVVVSWLRKWQAGGSSNTKGDGP